MQYGPLRKWYILPFFGMASSNLNREQLSSHLQLHIQDVNRRGAHGRILVFERFNLLVLY